jgi:uncharacterized protein YkwD/uncharacterized membrane protein required for colicin V production
VNLEGLVNQFNWLDWVLLGIVVLSVLGGVQRGFVLGVLDIMGVILAFVAAILGYRHLADLALEFWSIPSALATIGAFVAITLIAQVVYWLIVNNLLHLSRPMQHALRPLAGLDRLLGAIPGLVRGLFYTTLALLPFALVPIVPSVSAAIEGSTLSSRLVAISLAAAPELESRLGRDLEGGLTFIAPPQTDQGRDLNLGNVGQLVADPEAEQRMLELLNHERQVEGLSPLEFDLELREVARAHSREMFELSYFSHTSPATGSPFDRIRAAGIAFLVAGENLAYAPNVRIAHEGLMNSPGHRANILRPAFGRVGIGAIRSEFRGTMFTQKFRN